MTEAEIWSKKLTKVYGKRKKVFKAVNGIDLNVEPGIHGFLGPNGAGKTTTINMLVGALSITSGKAKVRDKEAGSVGARQLIGFLPQDPVFYEKMSGEEYLLYMAKLGGLKGREAKKRAQELMEYFDIFEARTRIIGKYSGGMKQKIGIAAALIHKPKILILDEPTANLDPIGRGNIIQKIRELSEEVSVFVSSHILSEIEQMCKKVTMIDKGELIICDEIKNIKQKYAGNVWKLDTANQKNLELMEYLQKKDYILKVWLDEEEGSLRIVPKDPSKLQVEITKILADNGAILKNFAQPEISLQDIFMEIIAKRSD